MDVLSTAINAAVIAIVGGLSARYGRVDSVRSDLTQLALALGVRPRASER